MDYHRAKNALYEICKEGGSGDESEVKKILDKHPFVINEGLDRYGDTILILACHNHHVKVTNQIKIIIKLLLSYDSLDINKQNNDGCTALYWASEHGHKEIVEILLSHCKIDINLQNKNGWTALLLASYNGHKDIVELLLFHYNIDINKQDMDGCTALHRASEHGHKEIVEILLSHSTLDVNRKNNREATALHSASTKGQGHKEIVALLLSRSNIDVNIQDFDGYTALHRASMDGCKEIVALLLSNSNIDINLKNSYGKLANDLCCDGPYANQSNKHIILELLKNHNKAHAALTSSTITTTKQSNEGRPSNVFDQNHHNNLKSLAAIEQKENRSDEPKTDFHNEHHSLLTQPSNNTFSIASIITTQTDPIAIKNSGGSVTDIAKDSIEQEDNHTLSKPVGEQIEK